MTWEQWLEVFNPGPAHPLKDYRTADFQVFLPASTANVGDVWDLDPEGILPFLSQFHPSATMNLRHGQKERKRAYGHFRLNMLTLSSESMRALR